MSRRKGIIYLVVVLLLGWGLGIVGWADISSRDPSTNSGTTGWTNPANAYTSNNLYATSITRDATWTYDGYGFGSLIPSGSIITKVEVGGILRHR